jgi:hypothetical protein
MLLPLEAHKHSRASDRSRSSSSITNPSSHTTSFLFSSSLSRLGRHPPFPLKPSHHDDAEERKEEEMEEEVEKGRDFGAARGTHR